MQELGHNIHMKLKEEFLPESKLITKFLGIIPTIIK